MYMFTDTCKYGDATQRFYQVNTSLSTQWNCIPNTDWGSCLFNAHYDQQHSGIVYNVHVYSMSVE